MAKIAGDDCFPTDAVVTSAIGAIMKRHLASLIFMGSALGQQPHYPFQNPDLPVEQRIDNLLSLMTVEEKINCLSTRTAVPRLDVPNIGSSEGIHGLVQRGGRGEPITTTQFPQPPGLGATWDPDLVRQAAGVEGFEARFVTQTSKYNRRVLQLWGPQSDLARDPRWGRSEEVYGEDPFLNGTMAAGFVKGLQGDHPKYWQAAALLKHFLANSNEDHRNVSTSDFDERLFWEYYSVPFRMGFVEGGATAVMASYNAWNGTPMTVNPVLRNVLREKWGVEVISTDAGAARYLSSPRKVYPDHKASVVACIKAGINQFLDPYANEAKAAFEDKSLTMADFDGALRPKFRIVIRLGLLDPPEMVPYSSIKDSPEPWTTGKHRAISLQAALESIVLLKNEKSFLPLDRKSLKSIAVIGPLADAVHWDWYGGTPPYAITPLAGIKEAAGPEITVNEVLSPSGAAAVAAARKSDVAVVIVGNDPKCGPTMGSEWYTDPREGNGFTLPCTVPSDGREGRDRETIDLYQEQLVKQVMVGNQKTVVVLVSSFPFAINWTQANVPAILQMAHSSQDEGTAIAKVLFGEYNPGGRLTVTWPKSLTQLPLMMDYDIRHGRTYMYFNEEPLYPFGFGLSYTTFRLSNLKTSGPRLAKDGSVTVSVDVTNTGTRAGDEVVQLYAKHLNSKVERPRQQLVGFQRVNVNPGETRTVEIPVAASRLAYWDAKTKALTVEAGQVSILAGESSANIALSTNVRVE
jgi:beta-glucosidase